MSPQKRNRASWAFWIVAMAVWIGTMWWGYEKTGSIDRKANQNSQMIIDFVTKVNSAVITADSHGTIRSWNDGARNMLGWEYHEAIGRHVTMIIPMDERSEHSSAFAESIRSGGWRGVKERTCSVMTRGGARVVVKLRVYGTQGDGGPQFTAFIDRLDSIEEINGG